LVKGLINAGNGVKAPDNGKDRVKSRRMRRKSKIDEEVWGMRVRVGEGA